MCVTTVTVTGIVIHTAHCTSTATKYCGNRTTAVVRLRNGYAHHFLRSGPPGLPSDATPAEPEAARPIRSESESAPLTGIEVTVEDAPEATRRSRCSLTDY